MIGQEFEGLETALDRHPGHSLLGDITSLFGVFSVCMKMVRAPWRMRGTRLFERFRELLDHLVFASGNIVAAEHRLPYRLTGLRDVPKRGEGGPHKTLMLGNVVTPPIKDRCIELRTSMVGLAGKSSLACGKVCHIDPRSRGVHC